MKTEEKVLSGLAGALALASGSLAYADIVVVGVPTDLVPTGQTGFHDNNVFWDIDGDGTDDLEFSFRGVPISSIYQWQANVFTLEGSNVSGYGGLFVTYYGARLAMRDSVAGSGLVGGVDPVFGPDQVALGSDYYNTGYGGWGGVGTTQTGYLGFSFTSGGETLYGWVELAIGPGGIQFLGAAYENSGADIAAGAIPAPGALGVLALGGGALLRRKRAA